MNKFLALASLVVFVLACVGCGGNVTLPTSHGGLSTSYSSTTVTSDIMANGAFYPWSIDQTEVSPVILGFTRNNGFANAPAIWRNGNLTTLSVPTGYYGFPAAIAGDFVCGYVGNTGRGGGAGQISRWSISKNVCEVLDQGYANDINHTGAIVGLRGSDPMTAEPGYYTPDNTWVPLAGVTQGKSAYPFFITDDGTVVGILTDTQSGFIARQIKARQTSPALSRHSATRGGGETQVFRWKKGAMSVMQGNAVPEAINSNGDVLVNFNQEPTQEAVWKINTSVPSYLEVPVGQFVEGYSLNNAGLAIGTVFRPQPDQPALIAWDQGKLHDITALAGKGAMPVSVDNAGRLLIITGDNKAVILTPK